MEELSKQEQELRNLLFVRPSDLKEIENKAVNLCDSVYVFLEYIEEKRFFVESEQPYGKEDFYDDLFFFLEQFKNK
jgi:hypothetical protein